MLSVPNVLLLIVLIGLYMYLTGDAGDAKWYIWSTNTDTHTHYKCNITNLPSIINGFTTSWFISSKFSCPILTSYNRHVQIRTFTYQCSTFFLRPVKKLSTTVT